MVYTVTLNPALDRTIYVESLKPFDANRIKREERYAGGKGIDVSRALKELDTESVALGFIGGFAGREMEGRLLNEGIATDFTSINNETRVNVIIHDQTKNAETSLLAQGPEVQPFEIVRLVEKIESLANPEFLVVSGSLPPGVNPEIYRKILETARQKGVQTVLDTDGDPLKAGLKAKPTLIKPNVFELSRYAGETIETPAQILKWGNVLLAGGVRIVLVSMGAQGIIMMTDGLKLHAQPPAVEVVSTIGAGDSAVAGFVYGLCAKMELVDCLRWSVAAGTAATLCVGSGVCRLNDTKSLVGRVEVKQL